MNSSNTVIAYPIDHNHTNCDNLMEDSVYGSSLGDSKFAEDTIEMGTNFFSQLDSMIAAVKVESSALDTMKEKLKEVENLRNQISNFTKRLLDADQTNLNLKANLVKAQEMYADIKKSKAEVESTIVPIRQELNRAKEQCNKERTGRLAAQQQITQLKDQIAQLENMNEMFDREVKTIPALNESNEILKNDLTSLRKRYKDEKNAMQKHIKLLESQSKDVDVIRGCVRELSLKLLDVCNNNNSSISSTMQPSLSTHNMRLHQQNRYQPQPLQTYQTNITSNSSNTQGMNNIYYETDTINHHHHRDNIDVEDEYDEEDYEDEEGGNDYISGAYLEEGSQISGMGESITSKHSMEQHASSTLEQKNNTTGGKKKKKNTNMIRRVMNNTVGATIPQQKNTSTHVVRMMQQQQQQQATNTNTSSNHVSGNVVGSSNSNGQGHGNVNGGFHHDNNMNHSNYNNNNSNYNNNTQHTNNNMNHSFSLPRI